MKSTLELKTLSRDSVNTQLLQKVYEQTPGYFLRVKGSPAEAKASEKTLTMLPDGMNMEAKFSFGIYFESELIGIVDAIRGYPDDRTAFLGLFLISEPFQKRKLGFSIYQEFERQVLQWPEILKLRLSVLEANSQVIPFWQKCGYRPTGERKPYEEGRVKSEHILFEKVLRS